MPHDRPPEETGADPAGAPDRPTWGARATVLAAVALVLLPLAAAIAPREVSQWYLAAAHVRQARGKIQEALPLLDQAIEWDAEDPQLWLLRARWHHELGDLEKTRADVQQAAKLVDDNLADRRQLAEGLQLIGQHQRAIEQWESIVKASRDEPIPRRADLLNAVAYARAIANSDLPGALGEINQALRWMTPPARKPKPKAASDSQPDESAKNEPEKGEPEKGGAEKGGAEKGGGERTLPSSQVASAAMLDTRGFILWRMGRFDEARSDLDRAVRLAEREFEIWLQNKDEIPDQILANEITQSYRRNVAVIRYHRALTHQSLGNALRAQVDLRRVRDLGFEPDEQLF